MLGPGIHLMLFSRSDKTLSASRILIIPMLGYSSNYQLAAPETVLITWIVDNPPYAPIPFGKGKGPGTQTQQVIHDLTTTHYSQSGDRM